MYLAKIHVTLKPSVLDPRAWPWARPCGTWATRKSPALRQGKYLELRLEDKGLSLQKAKTRVDQMCAKLLANTQIERYEFSVTKESKSPKA